jgi:formin-1
VQALALKVQSALQLTSPLVKPRFTQLVSLSALPSQSSPGCQISSPQRPSGTVPPAPASAPVPPPEPPRVGPAPPRAGPPPADGSSVPPLLPLTPPLPLRPPASEPPWFLPPEGDPVPPEDEPP